MAKSPAGYLVAQFDQRRVHPARRALSPKPNSERQAEAKQAKAEDRNRQERRRKQEMVQNVRHLAEQVKTYCRSLMPEQVSQLEANAIAQASEEMRRNLDEPAMKSVKKTLISGLVKEHIVR